MYLTPQVPCTERQVVAGRPRWKSLSSEVRDRILLDALAERVDDGTPEACDWHLLEAWRARLTRDPGRAVALAEGALAWATTHQATELEIRAAIQRSTLHYIQAEYEQAATTARLAFDRADEAGDAVRIIKALTMIADANLRRGRHAEALKLYQGALQAMPSDYPSADRVVPLLGVADAQRALGDVGAAREALERAAALPGIDLGKQAHIENGLGDLCRAEGALERAVAHYGAASRLYHLLGSAMAAYPELNLGLVGLELKRVGEVYARMTQLLGRIQARDPSSATAAFARVVRLPCIAAPADGDFETELAWLVDFIARTGIVERDIASCAERAADRAWEAARPERAIAALQVALQQHQALGDTRLMGRLERRLDRWRQHLELTGG